MEDLNKYWALIVTKERGAPISIYECVLHTSFYEKDPWSLRPADYCVWREVEWERVVVDPVKNKIISSFSEEQFMTS